MYDDIDVINATYTDLETRDIVICDYVDKNGRKREAVPVDKNSELFKKILTKFSYNDIAENTEKEIQEQIQIETDFRQFIQYKKEGKIVIEKNDKSDSELSIKKLNEITTENLFKIKLEIFEKDEIQNLENKNLRSLLRKSKNIYELLFYYYLTENSELYDKINDVNEDAKEIDPNNILNSIENLNAENLFKLKLQLFEKEIIQNTDDRVARSNLRKSATGLELLSNYYNIIKNQQETPDENQNS